MSKANTFVRVSAFTVVAAAVGLMLACDSSERPKSRSAPGAAGAQSQVRGGVAASPPAVADLFPAAPARELVLDNCGTCHNVACTVIGQRSPARWQALKDGHTEKVKGIDLDAIFDYLQLTFNDSKPEPKVPSSFMEGGCTPF